MKYQVITGNNIDTLKGYPDNHFDSIVTDPPYGIEFLGKDWDSNTGAIETWQECLRVLKPGGYILAFSAARTYHQLATNIESVGFEIRDQIMWIYGSGFPKAQDMGKAIDKREGKGKEQTVKADYNKDRQGVIVDLTINGVRCPVCNKDSANRYHCGKGQECGMVYKAESQEAQQWAGWKTALKPAHEPIVMARKPFKGSCVDNVLEHGVGALNIDATRVDVDPNELESFQSEWDRESAGHGCLAKLDGTEVDHVAQGKSVKEYMPTGRFPSNVIGEITAEYQKYFYCPKVSRAERHTGFEAPQDLGLVNRGIPGDFYSNNISDYGHNVNHREITQKDASRHMPAGNHHPTVKPVALMRYLITLVTPPGGHVLDPFNGSGSTGMAAVELGYQYTGCELDPAYADIARKRIEAWYHKTDISGSELPTEWFDEAE